MTIIHLDTRRPGGCPRPIAVEWRPEATDRLETLIGDLIDHGWARTHGEAIDDLIGLYSAARGGKRCR